MDPVQPEDNEIAERITRIREAFTAARASSGMTEDTSPANSFNDFINFVKWEPSEKAVPESVVKIDR